MGNALIIGDAARAEDLAIRNQQLEKFVVLNNNKTNRIMLENAGQEGVTFGGRRDLYSILGYPRYPTYYDYAGKYERQDITQRIINAYPEAIWSTRPTVTDDTDKEDGTPFEEAFEEFAEKSKLFHYIMRLDKLAGLGQYAVLFIGVRDGRPLDEPMGPVNGEGGFTFYKPFSESAAVIYQFEEDMGNPRYGLPLMYRVTTGGYGAASSGYGSPNRGHTSASGGQMRTKVINVHHSRMLHVAEGTLTNDVYGMPRLRPVINRLLDLEKVVGGSSEIFWLNGRAGLSLNAQADTHIKDEAALEKHALDYQDQLNRILQTHGMDVKTLEMTVADPDKHVAVILDLVASATGIPKRILIGSERGELASSQDEKNWWTRVIERRNNFCEPVILRPLVDMLIDATILPTPDSEKERYNIVWDKLGEASPTEKADIAEKTAKAIASYVSANGADLLVPPKQFVEEILCLGYRLEDILTLMKDDVRQEIHDAQFGDATAEMEAKAAAPAAGGGNMGGGNAGNKA